MEDDSKNRTREVTEMILDKVAAIIAAVKDAKRTDQVVCALHSLAVRLFPLDSHALSGSIDQQYRDQVLSAKVPSEQERTDWWRLFYQGAAFPTLARVLLYDVASNWLACFPFSARKHVYDVFFVNGLILLFAYESESVSKPSSWYSFKFQEDDVMSSLLLKHTNVLYLALSILTLMFLPIFYLIVHLYQSERRKETQASHDLDKNRSPLSQSSSIECRSNEDRRDWRIFDSEDLPH